MSRKFWTDSTVCGRPISRGIGILLVTLFLYGIAYGQSQNDPPLGSDEIAPPPTSLPVDPLYTLKPKDVINIRVFREPDLNVSAPLETDSTIVVPLLGRVSLENKTLREAETHIRNLFIKGEFLIDPQVTITIRSYGGEIFYIFGEIARPGAKAMPAGKQQLDILEAITLAGDFTQFAKRSEIVVRRQDPTTGQEESFTIDFDKVLRGRGTQKLKDIQILPGDILFVPERLF